MENNIKKNSCMMLAMCFYTPVDLISVLEEQDLSDYGIECDPHITIFYKKKSIVPKDYLLEDTKILLEEDYEVFMELLKSNRKFSLMDIFELDKFENSKNDYLVMKLKSENEIWKILNILNKGFSNKYDIQSDFNSYSPHMTLAELKVGTVNKYINSKKLRNILNLSKIGFEDLIISYGLTGNPGDTEQWSITKFHAIERHLRNERTRKETLKGL